ncbi:MAG: hypothetical protein ACRDZZ_06965, partial [Ilumatobacteraceae bacterium]
GCDAAGNCFDDGSDPVELDAPVGSEIAVEGGLGTLTAETDSFGATSPLPMLPRRDGTWLVNQPVTSQVLTATVRDDHPDGSWAAYQVTVSPNGDPAPPPSVDLPPAHPLVPAAQPPGDLPGVVVGARDNDLVRLDRATGGETVLVGDVAGAAGDDGGCADACGIYQVSVSADGSYVVYGGPGPAIGQLYVIPSDGSGDPGHVFGGGSPGALAPDGTVAAGVAGSVFLGQADEPPPVQVAAERLLGESSQTVVPAFTPDGSRLFVAVATATGTDVVALDPAALDGTIEPVITAPGIDWVALVVRADGTLGALRRSLPGAGPVVVDVIDPAAGAVVDSIVIDDGSAAIQPTGWIDIDAAGRYLLFTDGAGQLRWTDFEVVGTIGDGWGDAGW